MVASIGFITFYGSGACNQTKVPFRKGQEVAMSRKTHECVWMYSVLAVILLLVAVATGCNDIKDGSILMIESTTQSSQSQPAFEVWNTGERDVYISSFGFVLRADGPLNVEVPYGCHTMYEDMPDERVLRIVCPENLVVPADDVLEISLTVTGDWTRLDLVSMTSVDEYGYSVLNDLSATPNQPFWTN